MKALEKLLKKKLESDKPGVYNKYIRKLDIDSMLKSARRFGTPQYFLDTDMLRARARFFLHTFRKHVPDVEVFYAFKCNDLPEIAKTVLDEGYHADVAGIYELQLAIKLGFRKIVFTGPGKGHEELRLAIEHDLVINVDNIDEIEKIISMRPKKPVKVGIRVNPSDTLTKAWSKFGVNMDELDKAINMVRASSSLQLKGLHFHCSWNQEPARYIEGIRALGKYIRKYNLEFLDLGGGFYPEDIGELHKYSLKYDLIKILSELEITKTDMDPYLFSVEKVDPLEKFARSIAAALKKEKLGCKIYLEPGRFIATHSTSILVRVSSVKGGCVITDGGINLVGDYRFEEYSFAPIVNLSSPSLQLKRKVIYGALCDPSDLWGYSYYGKEIKKGDVLAVLHQGAYTFCCAWRFIKPIAPYIAKSSDKIYIAKSREKFSDRYAGCRF